MKNVIGIYREYFQNKTEFEDKQILGKVDRILIGLSL